MDEPINNKEPQSNPADQQKEETEQKPSSYFDRLRVGLLGQRRARRTFAKHR